MIAAELPHRTEHAVRNRWTRLQNLDSSRGVYVAGQATDGRFEEFDEYLEDAHGVSLEALESTPSPNGTSGRASACGYDEEIRQLSDLIPSPDRGQRVRLSLIHI